jgi:hypothetical protein
MAIARPAADPNLIVDAYTPKRQVTVRDLTQYCDGLAIHRQPWYTMQPR